LVNCADRINTPQACGPVDYVLNAAMIAISVAPIVNNANAINNPPPPPTQPVGKVQNHHLVPYNNKTYNHQNHPLVKEAGANLKTDPRNQVPLANHAGPHSQSYHSDVNKILNEEYAKAAGKGPTTASNALNTAYQRIYQGIQDGSIRPYVNKDVFIP
jgi:hypothetical protein